MTFGKFKQFSRKKDVLKSLQYLFFIPNPFFDYVVFPLKSYKNLFYDIIDETRLSINIRINYHHILTSLLKIMSRVTLYQRKTFSVNFLLK